MSNPSASPSGSAALTQATIVSCLLPGRAASSLTPPNHSPRCSQGKLWRHVIHSLSLPCLKPFSVVPFFLKENLHSLPWLIKPLLIWLLDTPPPVVHSVPLTQELQATQCGCGGGSVQRSDLFLHQGLSIWSALFLGRFSPSCCRVSSFGFQFKSHC